MMPRLLGPVLIVAGAVVALNARFGATVIGSGFLEERCSSDSVTAAGYRAVLEQLYRDAPATSFTWSRDARTCAAAAQADTSSQGASAAESIFVFTVKGNTRISYAVVTRWTLNERAHTEWSAHVCLFDRRWRMQGICIAT
jgi:hypothetical protein